MARAERIAGGSALLVLMALLGALVGFRAGDPQYLNHDVACVLRFAERLLDGAHFYTGVVEPNPPWVYWLSAPAVALARGAGVPAASVHAGLTLALIALSAALCGWILRAGWAEERAVYRRAVVGACIGVCGLLLGARPGEHPAPPGYSFGQREHLLVVLALPYLFAAASFLRGRPVGGRLAALAGVLAAAGLLLKPHLALAWLLVEVDLFFAARGRGSVGRVENRAIAGAVLLAVGAFLLLEPGYFRVAAMALRVYGGYDNPIEPWNRAALRALAALALFALVRPPWRERELPRVLLLAAAGFLMGALLQGKGWGYHFLPTNLLVSLLLVLLPLGWVARAPMRRAPLRALVAAAPLLALAGLLTATAAPLVAAIRERRGDAGDASGVERLAEVIAARARGGYLLFLSTSVHPAFPAVDLSGSLWTSRSCCLWLLPGLYAPEQKRAPVFPYRTREQMGEIERFLVDALVEDMQQRPPAVIVVDARRAKQGFGRTAFDFVTYFSRDPRFAEMFRAYRPVGEVSGYRVFVRAPRVPARAALRTPERLG